MSQEQLAECEKCSNLTAAGTDCEECGTYMPTGDDLADEAIIRGEHDLADLYRADEE